MLGDADALAFGAPRIAAVDAARGIALIAMAVYHFSWDLSFLQLAAIPVMSDPGWRWFARIIAGSFLFLVGVSLVLAHGTRIRRRAFLKRLAIVSAAAAGVTAATFFAFPASFIYFGILHCIALSSVLALPFLRAPLALLAGTAALCFAAPLLFTAPALDAPWLDWLGLGSRSPPPTNDYVPVFPWFGFVLLGVAAGRLIHRRTLGRLPASRRWTGPLARALIWSGRRSLLIYLLHQPLLLGSLLLLVRVTGPNPAAQEADYRRECQVSCVRSGAAAPRCRAGCACAVERLKGAGLWSQALGGQATPAEQERLSSLAQQCFRE